MKTSTDITALLRTGSAQTQLVTFDEYVRSKVGAGMNVAEEEKWGRKVYGIAIVLVLDNGFSIEAKGSFPIVQNSFSLPNLAVWAFEFRVWRETNLSRPEQKLFRTLKFVP